MNVVRWRAPEVEAAMERAMREGMDAAGRAMVAAARQKLSTPAPPHSTPGQPPHKMSGQLRGDQSYKITQGAAGPELHVGVFPGADSYLYAVLLAKGSPGGKVKKRPWLDDRRLALMAAANVVEHMRRAAK